MLNQDLILLFYEIRSANAWSYPENHIESTVNCLSLARDTELTQKIHYSNVCESIDTFELPMFGESVNTFELSLFGVPLFAEGSCRYNLIYFY